MIRSRLGQTDLRARKVRARGLMSHGRLARERASAGWTRVMYLMIVGNNRFRIGRYESDSCARGESEGLAGLNARAYMM